MSTLGPTASPTSVIDDASNNAIDISGLVFGIVTVLGFLVLFALTWCWDTYRTSYRIMACFTFITYWIAFGLVVAEGAVYPNLLSNPNYNDTDTNIFLAAFSLLIINSALLIVKCGWWFRLWMGDSCSVSCCPPMCWG